VHCRKKDNSASRPAIRLNITARRSRFYRPRGPMNRSYQASGKVPTHMIPMRLKHAASAAAVFLCLATVAPSARAQAPDNSSHNKDQRQTADTQSNAKSDRDTTAKIRKDLMADKGLSTYAHNVKIITANGAVTLKGPVKSEDEKAKVAQIAGNVVSPDKVTNEITVK